jgi:hypothetical protein
VATPQDRRVTGEPLPPKAPNLTALLEPLVRHGVEFVVIGGMAGNLQGSNYPSFDLDIAYARDQDNLERLVAALTEIGVALRGAPADLPFQLDARTVANGANFTFVTPHGDFDILADVAGIKSYESLKANAETGKLGDFDVAVASIDDLIAMKRASNRTKDRLMLEEYIVIADEQRKLAEGDQSSPARS